MLSNLPNLYKKYDAQISIDFLIFEVYSIILKLTVAVIVAIVEKFLCVLRAQMYIVDFEKMLRDAGQCITLRS
jgi:hypothetical protein